MKYIGIDARFFSTGSTGIGRYVYEMIRNLLEIIDPNQIKLVIFINEEFINNPIFLDHSNKIIIVPHKFDHYSINSTLNFHKILNSVKLDLLHVPHFNIPYFYKGNYVVTIHDLIHHKYPPKLWYKRWKQIPYLYLFKKAVKYAQKIICVSQSTKDDLLSTYPYLDKNKISVSYESMPDEFRDHIPEENSIQKILKKFSLEHQKYCLYLGRHAEHKNLETVIKAFGLLKNENSNLKFIIGGKISKDTEILINLVKNLNLKENVKFIGFLSDEEYKILLHEAYAYIQPSIIEGFGLPVLEAMSQHCPVIISKTPALLEISGENNVLSFEILNPEDLKNQILKLQDNNLRGKLIQNSHNHIKKFSWRKMAEEILEIYQRLN